MTDFKHVVGRWQAVVEEERKRKEKEEPIKKEAESIVNQVSQFLSHCCDYQGCASELTIQFHGSGSCIDILCGNKNIRIANEHSWKRDLIAKVYSILAEDERINVKLYGGTEDLKNYEYAKIICRLKIMNF